MGLFKKPVEDLIEERSSWRKFTEEPIEEKKLLELKDFIQNLPSSPFGTEGKFKIIPGKQKDPVSLKKHGTYGFIKNPGFYVVCASKVTPDSMVDLGYLTELVVLKITDLELGSCWLGGSFTKSSFSNSISCSPEELVPYVIAAGNMGTTRGSLDKFVRWSAKATSRQEFSSLFFEGSFNHPMKENPSEIYTKPLQMVRLSPSASNRQPWRVIKEGSRYHFFVKRLKSYNRTLKLMKLADLPATDVGIGMSHFQQTLKELSLKGRWEKRAPSIEIPSDIDYTGSWIVEN